MHALGQLVLAAVVIGGSLLLFARVVSPVASRSRNARAARAGRSMSRLTSPRHIRAAAQAEMAKTWAKVQAADWLDAQRHARRTGVPAPGLAAEGTPPAKLVRLGAGAVTAAATPAAPGRPAAAPSGQRAPATTPPAREGTAKPMSGSSEALIEAVDQQFSTAVTGGMRGKHKVFKEMGECVNRQHNVLGRIAAIMDEPDAHYDRRITEPLLAAVTHLKAAEAVLAEADAAMAMQRKQTLDDMMDTASVPHYAELNGTR